MSDSIFELPDTLTDKEFSDRMKQAHAASDEVVALNTQIECLLKPVSRHLFAEIETLPEMQDSPAARAVLRKIMELPQEFFRMELTMALINRVGQGIMKK